MSPSVHDWTSRPSVLHRLRQPDLCEPEIIDALHEDFERVQLHGFGEVAICVELIGFRDVCLRVGSGQDHRWDRFQAVVTLDLSQDLATIDFRKVQVQQDEVRTAPKRAGGSTLGGGPAIPPRSIRLRDRLTHERRSVCARFNDFKSLTLIAP